MMISNCALCKEEFIVRHKLHITCPQCKRHSRLKRQKVKENRIVISKYKELKAAS